MIEAACPAGYPRAKLVTEDSRKLVGLQDHAGNVLVLVQAIAEPELSVLDSRVPVAASFVVVMLNRAILMIFDSWRRQWELPGGARENGETPAQAARRELHEETGIDSAELTLDSIAEFELQSPARREYVAVYRAELRAVPHLVVNNEAMAFLWWDPRFPPLAGMNPLDAEIGRHVLSRMSMK